jgi:hypothetical protein
MSLSSDFRPFRDPQFLLTLTSITTMICLVGGAIWWGTQ